MIVLIARFDNPQGAPRALLVASVVDWHHVDADPDQDGHQNVADPTPSFTHVGKSKPFLLLVTALIVFKVLSFLAVSNVSKIYVFWTPQSNFVEKV
jgi:hypothetical protein